MRVKATHLAGGGSGLKVLQINSVCGVGSTGKIAADLADVLRQNGHDCLIAYGRGQAPQHLPAVKIGSEWNVRLHGMYSRLTDRHGFWSRSAARRLVQIAREYQPDLIHLHNLHGYYLHLPTLFAYLKASGKPVVWTLHDCWSFTGHCAYFSYANCQKWRQPEGCFACPQRAAYPKSLLVDNSKKNFRDKRQLFTSLENVTLITPSQWLAETVRQSFLGAYPVQVIPNGIDLSVFQPAEGNFRQRYGLTQKKILLGVANVWEPRKGLRDFLQLARMVDTETVIVLVGVSRQQLAQLPANILGIERTENARQLAEIYTAADVYLNPSVEETMGLTTVEALACGTPVAVYDATAVPEVVDETCGRVVPAGDVEALYRASMDCMARVDRQACIQRARQYEKHTQYLKYIDLYQSLVHEDETT